MIHMRATYILYMLISSATFLSYTVLTQVHEYELTLDESAQPIDVKEYQIICGSIKRIEWNKQSTEFAIITEDSKIHMCNSQGQHLRTYSSRKKLQGICFTHQGDGLFLIGMTSIEFLNFESGEITNLIQLNSSFTCYQLDPNSDIDAIYLAPTVNQLLHITKNGEHKTLALKRNGAIHEFRIDEGKVFMLAGSEDFIVEDGFAAYNGNIDKLELIRIDLQTGQEEGRIKIAKGCSPAQIKIHPESNNILAYNCDSVWLINKQTMSKIEVQRNTYVGSYAYISYAGFLPSGNIIIVEQNGCASIANNKGVILYSTHIGPKIDNFGCFDWLSKFSMLFGTNYYAATSKEGGTLFYNSKSIVHHSR